MIVIGNTLALLVVVPVLLMTWHWIRTPMFITPRGKRILLSLKLTILLFLLVALLDPRWPKNVVDETSSLVIAVDLSESIADDDLGKRLVELAAGCRRLESQYDIRMVLFDGGVTVLSADDTAQWVGSPNPGDVAGLRKRHRSARMGTDVGEGLRCAMVQIPAGRMGQVILLSDGRDNQENVAATLSALAAQGVVVHTVPLATRPPPAYPLPLRLGLPATAFIDEEIKAQVLIYSPADGPATLRLAGADGVGSDTHVVLRSGYSVHSVPLRVAQLGPQAFTVRVDSPYTPGGTAADAAGACGLVNVRRLPRVLVFAMDSGVGRVLSEVLVAEKIDFVTCTPASWPRDLPAAVRSATCVIINNLARKEFKDKELVAIRDSVKEGGGLMMIGGTQSFGAGDYTDTPIEEAMPVFMRGRR